MTNTSIYFNVSALVDFLGNSSLSHGEDKDLSYIGGIISKFSAGTVVVLTLLMSLVCLTTVLGNMLVILAFLVEKSLRKHSYYFLLNLAVCDLLVGSFSIPWYIPYTLTGSWTTGRGVCKFWLTMDSTVCIASVYSILFLSYDRYFSVTKAVTYRIQQGTKNVSRYTFLKIVVLWTLSFLLYGPAIVFWEYFVGWSIVPKDVCTYEFDNAWYFLLSASMFDFYTPFFCVIYFNLSIYSSIRKRNKSRLKSQQFVTKSESITAVYGREKNESGSHHSIASCLTAEGQVFISTVSQSSTSLAGERRWKFYTEKAGGAPTDSYHANPYSAASLIHIR
ncbi:histamine H3 receptor-like [Rhinatrema bivittatum]|uniref:histamine H3 receptor-like n=1 Tax=Rhinatrema bivittatum TaxID=194408 RepID=UPI0011285D78|nr:histamine H3 receptor-like [Rhinatrema bivittatum]